jgi:hypothetical protein
VHSAGGIAEEARYSAEILRLTVVTVASDSTGLYSQHHEPKQRNDF